MAIGGGIWFSGSAAAAPARPGAGVAVTASAANMRQMRREAGARRTLLSAQLAPSVPADPAIFGVPPGAKPWVIRSGHVRLSVGGVLKVRVKGLVIPSAGKNPLPEIAAVVFCGGTDVATAGPVPFSAKGNARLDTEVKLPAFCPAPAVLMEPAHGAMTDNMYIAFDGKARK